jgi:hypothetical protein
MKKRGRSRKRWTDDVKEEGMEHFYWKPKSTKGCIV